MPCADFSWKNDKEYFIDAVGTRLGLDDQFASVLAGKKGGFQLNLTWDQNPGHPTVAGFYGVDKRMFDLGEYEDVKDKVFTASVDYTYGWASLYWPQVHLLEALERACRTARAPPPGSRAVPFLAPRLEHKYRCRPRVPPVIPTE